MLKRLPRADDADEHALPDLSSDALYFRYHLVEFVTDHLIDVSRTFDGDLQEALVLAVVGQVVMQARTRHGTDFSKITKSIAASRIADITLIPRQTVRRKLASLHARGWIEQDETKSWRVVVPDDGRAAAQRDLAGLDVRGIRRGVQLASAYKERLEQSAGAVKQPSQPDRPVDPTRIDISKKSMRV
nr:hypothetical protein [uncultured Rhodopila sp.]